VSGVGLPHRPAPADESQRPPDIKTARLNLVVLLPEEIEALIEGDTARAGRLAGMTFPLGWPDDAAARQGLEWHLRHLRADRAQRAWRIRVMVEHETSLVVGSVNLKGPPDAEGDVEIGWGVNEDRRRRGYAFEAAAATMTWAAGQAGVRLVSATIPETNLPSQALAQKLGMIRRGDLRRTLPLWVRPIV
jgi:ribosomal-protein-alanine N-acetyltransferase